MTAPQSDRSDWLSAARKRDKDIFSELDVLLRALDRFIDIENLPGSRDDVADRNFVAELSAVRDTILRVIGLLDAVIPESRKNEYWFQKFAQAKLMSHAARDVLKEGLYRQDVPEKSVFLLYDTMVNLKGVISDILKGEHIPYLTFLNIGQITERELRENAYFNPFKKELTTEFDVIENQTITKIVRAITVKETRRYISMVMFYLFRILRYLKYADTSSRSGSISAALLILSLLRSETSLFVNFIDSVEQKIAGEDLQMVLKAIAYQFSMERKRVFQQELRDAFRSKSPQYLKGRIENSHGILKNLAEQGVVQIVRFFNPEITGDKIFETFVTRLEHSLRLREDLLILYRLLTLLDEAHSLPLRAQVFSSLRNFMLYFQNFTFKLLRYDDYEEFLSFFTKFLALDKKAVAGEGFGVVLDKVRHFKVFVGTCVSQVNNRAELSETPVDMSRVENNLKHYLK